MCYNQDLDESSANLSLSLILVRVVKDLYLRSSNPGISAIGTLGMASRWLDEFHTCHGLRHLSALCSGHSVVAFRGVCT